MYTEHFEVSSHDVDPNGIVRPSCLLRYMQESANHQMRDEKPSYMDLFSEGKAFLLSRMAVRSFAPLHQYDKIEAVNWPSPGKGATFYRCYRIERSGQLMAQGYGIWALVDVHTHHLYRASEVSFPNYTMGPLAEMDGVRFHVPDELERVGAHTVAYHEIDCNRHLNNTNYPDLLTDFLPEHEGHTVADFSIHFLKEAPLGEELHIYRSAPMETGEGLRYFFRTECASGGENIEAQLTLRAL